MVFQFHQFPDKSLTVLYVSPGCWELCEVPPEAFSTNFAIFDQLIHHEDISAFLESMAHATANCTPWFWEGRLITKGNRLKWVQGKAQLEPLADGIILWNGLFIDITDHKQAEFRLQEQLNQSEARYQAILTAISDSVWRISRNGEYLAFQGNESSFPVSPSSILGKNLQDVLSPDVAQMGLAAIAQTLNTGSCEIWEYQTSTSGGVRDYQARLVRYSQDEVLAIIQDVTNYKYTTSLERQVEERTTQLQQKMQELGRLQRIKDVMLHTIAHDLRTTVIGNLMVVQHLLNNQQVQKCLNAHPIHPPISHVILERMIQGNERQLNMIDSLLEIHYSEKQGIPLNCQKIPFFDLMNQILTDLQPLFSHNQATINHLITTDSPLVFVDVCRLQKVLANLFTHSLQQNPPGLNLIMKVEVEAEMIYTKIQHNGVTMSQTECDRLFDLYVRDPQSPCSTSIGLKLYLCRQIIQAHGGEIGVINQQNQGLTFWFTLPIARI